MPGEAQWRDPRFAPTTPFLRTNCEILPQLIQSWASRGAIMIGPT